MRGQTFGSKLGSVPVLCFIMTCAHAQKTTQATIEVETVKPHPPAVQHNNFSFARNRFALEDQSIGKLVAFAYGLNAKQIVTAPQWADDKRWDMAGTTNLMEDATLSQEQQLIRQLLVDRFGLKFHNEQREMSAYALQVVKGKPNLTAAKDPEAQPLEHSQGQSARRTESYTASTIGFFLTVRQLFMDRPLIDQTGLKGVYDFKLTYTYSDAPSGEADATPPLFTAIKEQLGLQFVPVKTAVNVMVIDHIEEPSDN